MLTTEQRSSTYLVPGERHGASVVSRHGGRGKRSDGGERGRLLSSRLWRTSASDNSVGNRRLSSSVITPLRPAASHSRAQERTDLIDDGGGDPFTFTIVLNGHRRAAAVARSKRHETTAAASSSYNFPRVADHIVSRRTTKQKHNGSAKNNKHDTHATWQKNYLHYYIIIYI